LVVCSRAPDGGFVCSLHLARRQDHCAPRETCSSISYASQFFTLSESVVKSFYELDGLNVHAIQVIVFFDARRAAPQIDRSRRANVAKARARGKGRQTSEDFWSARKAVQRPRRLVVCCG
jgi:hypothetical protein